MKKAYLYFAPLALCALAMTGCDDTTDGGVMQVNPQQPEFTPADITVTTASPVTSDGSINLADAALVSAVSYTVSAELPEDAVVSFEMQVSGSEDFAGAITIPMERVGETDTYGVDAQLWDNAFRSLLGKAPFERTNYVRFAGYINVGSQRSRIGTPDTWYCPTKVNVTPVDLGIQVEDAYYLVGTVNGWDLATAVKFSHSDKNVYDDPVFTLCIDITAEAVQAGWWWKIVPESSFAAGSWEGLFGTEKDGDTALSGNLFEDGNSGCLNRAGQQLFTIDMLNCTYSVTNAVPMLWTPGNSNDWTPETSGTLTTSDFTNYNGFLHLNGEWLMTPAANWDNKYTLGTAPGTLIYNGDNNLPVPAEGDALYWVEVNLGSLTYSTTAITKVGMIGGFNDWAGDLEMTPSADLLTWTADLDLAADTELKVRFNGDWAINLGAPATNLVFNAGNIAVAAGSYAVTLNLTTHPYTLTFTAK
ncbi:MAG: hypothetical protein K2K40_04805 [Paramuribaculum sp.]|nr:hypothetical protein [Paramuribaculum sp.]